MWNYMGWDNLSTIAGEVESPQRTYSRAMFGAVILVVVSLFDSRGAVARTGIDPNQLDDRRLGGCGPNRRRRNAGHRHRCRGRDRSDWIVWRADAFLHAFAAGDGRGRLPAADIFARRDARTGAPWVAILACAILWAACFPLGFEKSLILDVLLTGLSILLEFWALVALRVREPDLPRPFRVPGGIAGAVAIGIPPLALMIAAVVRNRTELVGSTNELVIGIAVIAAGVALYFVSEGDSRKKGGAGSNNVFSCTALSS